MRCLVCRVGETGPGVARTTLDRDETVVVFNNVPADVCDNCGEEYLEASTLDRLQKLLNEAVQNGVRLQVREYSAA